MSCTKERWAVMAVVGLLIVGTLSACSGYLVPRQQKGEFYAGREGWEHRLLDAPPFSLVSYSAPGANGSGLLTIYIEGDGLAFLGRRTVSRDPTPDDPVALRLALAHPGGAAAYLARPCQYVMTQACQPAYWSSHRYAPEVVAAMDAAIDTLKRRSGANRLILVGYSGGGALAALVASERSDVAGLVTVAANLDLTAWTTRHGLAPLRGSRDPADAAMTISHIPQVHFVGGRDDVVPAEVGQAFLGRMGNHGRAKLVRVERFDHTCCWVDNWRAMARAADFSAIPDWPGGG